MRSDQRQDDGEQAGERGSQSINRALSVLAAFTIDSPSLPLKDICDMTSLTLPTTHRIVKTLQRSGYLIHDDISGRYSLGPAVVQLAQIVFNSNNQSDFIVTAIPHLQQLRDSSGETAGLHLPRRDGRICVAEVESRHMMRMATGVGQTMPWHAGAASKAMLAFMPPEEGERLLSAASLSKLTDLTPTSKAAVRAELADVAKRGYAMSLGESVTGAGAISIAVRDASGRVVAAINITGPLIRWTQDRMLSALPALRQSVRQIEQQLGRSAEAQRRVPS